MFISFKKTTLAAIAAIAFSVPAIAEMTGHVDDTGVPFAQIETLEQSITYANLQNLVARWNNTVILAKTGEEQLKLMQESKMFADDFTIAFNLPNGSRQTLTGLNTEEATAFYNQVVNGLGQRVNLSSNIEVLKFSENGAIARFKYLVLVDGQNTFGGENIITIEKRNGKVVVTNSEIHLLIANTPSLE